MLSLESLAIRQPFAHLSLPLPKFPWNQLKRLTLSTPPLSQCASIVSWCVQLEHITLFIWPSKDRLPPVFIVSQTVTSATLKWVEEEGCQNLFPSLQFPKLHTLELDSCPLPADSIYPFIPDSPSITSLCLTDFGFVHNLPVLLRLLPTITHFSFQNSRFCQI